MTRASSTEAEYGTTQLLLTLDEVEAPERSPIAGGPRVTVEVRGPGGTLYVRTRPPRALTESVKSTLKQSSQRTFKR